MSYFSNIQYDKVKLLAWYVLTINKCPFSTYYVLNTLLSIQVEERDCISQARLGSAAAMSFHIPIVEQCKYLSSVHFTAQLGTE